MISDFSRASSSEEEEDARRLAETALCAILQSVEISSQQRPKLLTIAGNEQRFAAMARILEDRKTGRSENYRLFLGYWRQLAREMIAARQLHQRSLDAGGTWDFPQLLQDDLERLQILAALRWQGLRCRLGLALRSERVLALGRRVDALHGR